MNYNHIPYHEVLSKLQQTGSNTYGTNESDSDYDFFFYCAETSPIDILKEVFVGCDISHDGQHTYVVSYHNKLLRFALKGRHYYKGELTVLYDYTNKVDLIACHSRKEYFIMWRCTELVCECVAHGLTTSAKTKAAFLQFRNIYDNLPYKPLELDL